MNKLLRILGLCKHSELNACRSELQATLGARNTLEEENQALKKAQERLLNKLGKKATSQSNVLYNFKYLTSMYNKNQLNALVYDSIRVAASDPDKIDLLDRWSKKIDIAKTGNPLPEPEPTEDLSK